MRNLYFVLLISALTFNLSHAQTTATDWTANDCTGNSHNLFAELNQGKVIVLMWVMPCGLCISDALTVNTVYQSFASSGCDVEFYLIDDYANTSCSTLTSWAATNGIGPNVVHFSNVLIDMAVYGAQSMPKVVVVGGPSHAVYNIQNNSVNSTTLQNAITQACADVAAGVKDVSQNINALTLYPNPVVESASIKFDLQTAASLDIEICDLLGSTVKKIKQGNFPAGEQKLDVQLKELSEGIYFLRITEGTRSRVIKFTVQ